MQSGQWGQARACRCGCEIQDYTPRGHGFPTRIEVQTNRRHVCPLNAPRYEPIAECFCGVLVMRSEATGEKRDPQTGQPHVCRGQQPTPLPQSQPKQRAVVATVDKPAKKPLRGVIEL